MGRRFNTKCRPGLVPVLSPQETATASTPGCDQVKLRGDITAYMDVSHQLRTKRKYVYEADRRGTLKDQHALDMSVEVAKLKRSSDKIRLSVCEQLRALINEIHHHLDTTAEQPSSSNPAFELANKCAELLHSITITAIKEEIFEKERLLSNLRLHNGKSAVYVVLRTRWRVRPRSW
ncbi:hypothetical protein PHYPSEUDO_014072 [Phytophthora pseudosyringae]|uniref:Uncharacterized protein n=1 Tax=Phytophthora pseudosyringae TaxID=221518 RepID=A0A8T1V7E0_9STRA|nr:hypothetical protein PHYPSEUDO_014072 [Phytophthora pseudosyringae]